MIAEPPLLEGAAQDTVTAPFPGSTETAEGAVGAPAGVPGREFDSAPEPVVFTARILTLYVVPFERPEITSGEVAEIGERAVQALQLPPL